MICEHQTFGSWNKEEMKRKTGIPEINIKDIVSYRKELLWDNAHGVTEGVLRKSNVSHSLGEPGWSQ